VTHNYCVVYFPPSDAVVYLKEYYDAWRIAEVQCVCGDVEFCKKLERVAEQLWKAGGRRLSPQDVAAALSRWSP
jgi:hypothetical protein